MQLQRTWPDDIDSVCPQCDQQLNAMVHYSIGPDKLGQQIRRIHPWMLAIPIITFPAMMFLWMKSVHAGTQASSMTIIIIVIALIIPPMITGMLIILGRKVRRVKCYLCGYSADFPIINNRSEQVAHDG
jgi:hypothetical protein